MLPFGIVRNNSGSGGDLREAHCSRGDSDITRWIIGVEGIGRREVPRVSERGLQTRDITTPNLLWLNPQKSDVRNGVKGTVCTTHHRDGNQSVKNTAIRMDE